MNPADPLEMAILVPVPGAARVLESRSTRVRASVLVIGVLVASGLVMACADDTPLPSGPRARPTFDIGPNGGYVPEVTVTLDSLETISVNFTVPYGSSIIDGSPYGIGFGPWDTEYFFNNKVWSACSHAGPPCMSVTSVPSPQHWAQNHHSPSQDFMEFDPPVRSVEFSYSGVRPRCWEEPDCPDTFYVYAYTRSSNGWLGWAVDQAALRTNYWGDTPGEVWEPVQLTSSTDNIAWLYIDGMILIDDLRITRAATANGGVECDEVERGQPTTCRITDPNVSSVTNWEFYGTGVPPITRASTSTTWSGKAVLSGLVLAYTDVRVLSGDLAVADRRGKDAEGVVWDGWLDSLTFQGGTEPEHCEVEWSPVYYESGTVLGVNMRDGACAGGYVDPPASIALDEGYDAEEITDGGPNNGLWYVTAAFYRMDRVSLLNPFMRPGGETILLASKRDKRACEDHFSEPMYVSFYDYNKLCKNSDGADSLLAGLLRHEGYGTNNDPAQPNGHQARIELAAALDENDPYTSIEKLVASDSIGLSLDISAEILRIDTDVGVFADGVTHDYVKDNWCGSAWFYRHSRNRYWEKPVRMANGECP